MSAEMPYNNKTSRPQQTSTAVRPTSFVGELSAISPPSGTPINTTRIPIKSPSSLRRAGSLRVRGDRSRVLPPLLSPAVECGGSGDAPSPFSGTAALVRGCAPSTNSITAGRSPGVSRRDNKKLTPSPSRHRSLSLSVSRNSLAGGLRTPTTSPDRDPDLDLDDDDLDSLHSYSSVASVASCDHAYVARNGTTFSGRKMKYVVHCSSHAGQTGDEYLTPTQRAQRQIRRLKVLLQQAKLEVEKKDSEIFRLTKEVVELRLYKASLSSPDDKSNSSDAVTVRESTPPAADSPPPAPVPLDMQSSYADSGHFEDLASASPCHQSKDKACATEHLDWDEERKKLIQHYEDRLQEMSRAHGNESQELKKQHNDRVEALLKTLSEVNERYCQLVPDFEAAKERIRDLEKELDDVSCQLKASEEKQKKMYLQLYARTGQDVTTENSGAESSTSAASTACKVSVNDLLHQLQMTQTELDNIKDICQTADQYATSAQTLLSAKEAVSLWVLGARKAMYRRLLEAKGNKSELDPEVTLQFLKSAIYYFLTDKENHRGHLRAIESILGFSSQEISNIDKANAS